MSTTNPGTGKKKRASSQANKELVLPGPVPRHIAIIMDGNGRWAERRGLPRTQGHEAGVKTIREITEECVRIRGIEALTLFAMSQDNFQRRPKREVHYLLKMVVHYLRSERDTILDNNIRFLAIGDTEAFPKAVRAQLAKSIEESSANTGLKLCLALNYGGRQELARAARLLAEDALKGQIKPEDIDETVLTSRLYTREMPDPDLMIRTAGELRMSNFLLWQLSYAELWVTQVCWPDFTRRLLHEALRDYAHRTRKFGGLKNRDFGEEHVRRNTMECE